MSKLTLFELEIPDKPIIDSSFNQCLWQLKKDKGIMGKFTELLINSDGWKSSRCTLEWKAEYVKKNRYIFFLQVNQSELIPTPTMMEDRRIPNKEKERDKKLISNMNVYAYVSLLPTPESFDWNSARHPELWEKDKKKYAEKGINLHCNLRQQARLGMLPTPTLQDSLADVALGLNNPDRQKSIMQLNPQFVLEMMGFPINFTEKPYQNL